MTKKVAIAFDFDGTLVNTFPFFEEMIQQYSRENGLPPMDFLKHNLNYQLDDAACYGWIGVPIEEQRRHRELAYAISRRMVEVERKVLPPLFAGVKDVVRDLHGQGHTLMIVTSSARPWAQAILEGHGLDSYFHVLRTWTCAEAHSLKTKPEPDKLLHALAEAGVHPRDALMVGDTHWDITMGVRAGARPVGVSWGVHTVEELEKAGAVSILRESLEEIHSLL